MGGNGDSLDAANGPAALANAFGFRFADLRMLPGIPDGNYFTQFLRSAPFGLFGNRTGYGLHAIAINRLAGDFASPGSTRATGVDPADNGHPFTLPLLDLIVPSTTARAMAGHCVLWV